MGANGAVTIYRPLVTESQSSSERIKLINGGESIEAGWMVNPEVFNDTDAHLYGSFTARGRHCVNTYCAGFVQLSRSITLGVATPRYSTVGGTQFVWHLSIEKEQDGNWWLFLMTPEKVGIGYWPRHLFIGLANTANQVEWGGEVNNPGPTSPPPQMGHGGKARYDTQLSALFLQASVIVDESRRSVSPPDTEKVMDCVGWYTVLDAGDQGNSLGRLIFFGG
ncbi:hypothetical protein RND81_04G241400 [Saponaria officinalis]|uniref:Neprosin PEP catalytic domain-containing protein n=1 Tax=Saponaria officinalis TaxID=3572 RepID=A0AAW1LPG5_SAPOF